MAELELRDQTGIGNVGIQEQGLLRRIVGMREFGILMAAIALFVLLSILRPDTFFTEQNVFRVAQSISILTIIAAGMTFLFIAGELDLSVGTMHGLLALAIAVAMYTWNIPPLLAVPMVIALGAVFGLINGVITTYFGIPSFIVTLGMMSIYIGIMLSWVKVPPFPSREWKAEHAWYVKMMAARVWDKVPAQIFWMIGVVLVASFVLSRTKFGYHVLCDRQQPGSGAECRCAYPSDQDHLVHDHRRTHRAGLRDSRRLDRQHISRLWAGVRARSDRRCHHRRHQSLRRVGTVLGTLIGAIITGMIRNGLILLGAEQEIIPIAMGAVIILAVLVDAVIRSDKGLANHEAATDARVKGGATQPDTDSV